MSIAPPEIDFDELTRSITAEQEAHQRAQEWVTIVWNDPVNLMSYVSFVFQEYFGYSQTEADKLMMRVHAEGKAVVSRGSKEKMEVDTAALHGYGLWATFRQEG